LEAVPNDYVARLVTVFREVKRVLKADGTLWLNLGDTYVSNGPCQRRSRMIAPGIKDKDLIGIPWSVALALRQDGWYLRSDIIWHKSNPMPESAKDRPTNAHEHVFLFSKQQRYYYDQDAIREMATGRTDPITSFGRPKERQDNDRSYSLDGLKGANSRNVWTISTQAFKGVHFATMPPELAKRCILAGSRIGDTVLDPFGGSGTTGCVALEHGRDAILIELNADYIRLAEERLAEYLDQAIRLAAD
jgi:site-specific DNA-methyltransferase (adenine-specific)